MIRHFVDVLDLTPTELRQLLDHTATLKRETKSVQRRAARLPGQMLVQVFEKPSLRTRVSFETAMVQLGGSGIFMTEKEAGLHGRESLADVARVISSYADVITLRTFSHAMIREFAQYSRCPVINALSDRSHPCQALTDLFTMEEALGDLRNRRLTYVGDGNNVALSLAEACAAMNVAFVCAAPAAYAMDEADLDELRDKFPNAQLEQIEDPFRAVAQADVIYTDVWASMGQEAESSARAKAFGPYQLNKALFSAAPGHSLFMHCLPAKRGLEVTDDVIDSDRSIVFQQAENRMHLAKGLFDWLLSPER